MVYLRFAVGATLSALFYFGLSTLPSTNAAARSQKWRLIFSDEFNYTGKPDPTKWEFETDDGVWGNNEIQHYTDNLRNARVEDGSLIIEAHHEADGKYTSARMFTKGVGFKYGRFEARAKFPSGEGTWPAIWMMGKEKVYGNDVWPDNGEVDIVEHVGREPDQILGCIYTKNFNWMNNNGITKFLNFTGTEEGFHIYSLDWTPELITISVDGIAFNVFKNPHTDWGDWPFDQNMRLIMNFALASFGGDVDDAIFPQRMQVDYIRIYQPAPLVF